MKRLLAAWLVGVVSIATSAPVIAAPPEDAPVDAPADDAAAPPADDAATPPKDDVLAPEKVAEQERADKEDTAPKLTKTEPKVDEGPKDPWKREPWIKRYRPQKLTGELGVGAGVFIPSTQHDLYDPASAPPEALWQAGPDIAVRAGFYPLAALGVEAEFNAMPTRVRTFNDDPVFVYGFQSHVVVQLPFYSVVPFFLAGGGLLGVRSPKSTLLVLGNDIDPAVHYGGGVKINFHKIVGARIEARNIISSTEARQNSGTANVQVLASLTITLGRKPPKEPPPPPPKKDPDIDKDGIKNEVDECPKDPGPKPSGCPDSDGDKFIDKKDECPEVPGVAPAGCPVKDTDHDGFLDPDDDCVFEPETWNCLDDHDGCPDDLPPEFTGAIAGIEFDLKKDTIRAVSKPVLDRAVEVLKKFPDVRVKIIGHTDDIGTPEFNLDLSRRRAEAVKKYLVDAGIDGGRIETEGRGNTQPLVPNDSEANRAKNRRIEFEVLQRKKPGTPGADPNCTAAKDHTPAGTEAAPAEPR